MKKFVAVRVILAYMVFLASASLEANEIPYQRECPDDFDCMLGPTEYVEHCSGEIFQSCLEECGWWTIHGEYYFEDAVPTAVVYLESTHRDEWELVCDALTPVEENEAYEEYCDDGHWVDTLVPCGVENCLTIDHPLSDWVPGDECYSPMMDKYHDDNGATVCRSRVCIDEEVPAWYNYGGSSIGENFINPSRLDNFFCRSRKAQEFIRAARGEDNFIAIPEDICRIWTEVEDYSFMRESRGNRLTATSNIDDKRPIDEPFPIPQSSSYLVDQKVKALRETRQQWWANKTGVWSCEEYAYEKYYKLSRYEDYVAQFGTDFRKMYDIAFGESDVYDADNHEAALASCDTDHNCTSFELLQSLNEMSQNGDIDWYPPGNYDCRPLYINGDFNIRRENIPDTTGTPWTDDSPWPLPDPPELPTVEFNIDLATSHTFKTMLLKYKKAAPNFQIYDVVNKNPPKNDFMGLNVVDTFGTTKEYDVLGGIAIDDDELREKIQDAKDNYTKVPHDWAWHHYMSEGLAPDYLDEELYLFDELKDELEGLLDLREETEEALEATFETELSIVDNYFENVGVGLTVPGADEVEFERAIIDPLGPVSQLDSHPADIVWNSFVRNMMGYVATGDGALLQTDELDDAVALSSTETISDDEPVTEPGAEKGKQNRKNRGWASDWNSVKREHNCRRRDREGKCVHPWKDGNEFTQENYATIVTALEGTLSDEQVVNLATLMERHFGIKVNIVDSRTITDPNGNPLEATAYAGEVPAPDTSITPSDLYDMSVVKVLTAQQRLRAKIDLIDDMIEELLQRADDMGCFDLTDNFNPCDWSPKLFYKAIPTLTGNHYDAAALRESAYADCAKMTNNAMGTASDDLFSAIGGTEEAICGKTFTELWNEFRVADDPYMPEVKPGWGFYIYTQSTEMMDLLIRDANTACNELLKEAVRNTEELNDLGMDNADDQDNGGGHISLYFEYDFNYGVPGMDRLIRSELLSNTGSCSTEWLDTDDSCLPESSCDYDWQEDFSSSVSASVDASFEAGLQMFNKKLTLMGIHGRAEVAKYDGDAGIDMTIAGISFLGGMDNLQFDDGNPEEGNGKTLKDNGGKDKEWELFSFKKNFTIGPVPVSVAAGAVGAAGIEFAPDLQFKFPLMKDPTDSDTDLTAEYQIILRAGISITPYTRFDVFAAAAVDIGVAALGVRIDMTLIHLSLPFKVGFGVNGDLGFELGDGDRVMLTSSLGYGLSASLQARLNVLAGKFSLFAKVGIGAASKTYKKTLASWDGYTKTWPLIDFEVKPKSKIELGGSFIGPDGFKELYVNIPGGNENCLFPSN